MRLAYVCADRGVPVFGRKGSSIHAQEVMRALGRQGVAVTLFTARAGGTTPGWFDGDVRGIDAFDPAGFDVVYERYSLWHAEAIERAREAGVPALVEVNAPLIDEQASHRQLDDRASAERVADRVFGAASAVVAVSDSVAAYVVGRGVPPSRVHVVPNGVSPARFDRVTPWRPRLGGTFTVGFVGTLKAWHGVSTLVEAFARLSSTGPEGRLLIVGDGPERPALEAQVRALRLDGRVHWTGAVDADDVPGWLASMDVATAPYPAMSDFYFSPLKVYEYMAAGLPIVASRCGQLAALIEDDVNGCLCAPGDSPALTAALERLRRDAPLRRAIGAAARATITHGHTWDGVAGRIMDIATRARGAGDGARSSVALAGGA